MLSRILQSIKLCWHYRARLRVQLRSSTNNLPEISKLDYSFLQQQQVKTLILDFDGVLAPHGDLEPLAHIKQWLAGISQSFGQENIYILSNKPLPERQRYFANSFPGITFVRVKRPKPYPDGIQEVIKLTNNKPESILMVDDRLATGIIAALACNTQALLITKPYVNLRTRPIAESFFLMLRSIERGLLWLL